MDSNPALESDIDVTQGEAADVKGGGIVDASVGAAGASASVHDTNIKAKGHGLSAHHSSSGKWGAGAKAGGQNVAAAGDQPKIKQSRRRPLMP